jgi:hypothetical protein
MSLYTPFAGVELFETVVQFPLNSISPSSFEILSSACFNLLE